MVTDFKKNKSKIVPSKVFFHFGGLLVIGLIVFLLVANVRIYKKRQEFLAQISDLKNQIKDIENRNNDLKQGALKSRDTNYIEKVAREELDLQKPGEKAISFVMPESQPQKTDNLKQNNFKTWFGRVWDWLTGKE